MPPRHLYPFLDLLDAAAPDIRAEALALEPTAWAPMPGYPAGWVGFILDPGRFSADFPGVDFAANRARCPHTAAVVARIEGLTLAGFLRLEPGVTVASHADPRDDDMIRCHLGLRLPASEHAWWPEGRARLMDVRRPHWACNDGDEPRITLVVDVRMPFVVTTDDWEEWRPGVAPPDLERPRREPR